MFVVFLHFPLFTLDNMSSNTFVNKEFLTIDFESIDAHGTWIAYGVIVSSYPSGRIISQKRGACMRFEHEFDEYTKQFWECQTNKQILEKLTKNTNPNIKDEERQLCTYIRDQLTRCPDLVILQDNPQFDCAILNNMMKRNNMLPISTRFINNNRKYRSVICSKSFRSGVAMSFGRSRYASSCDKRSICFTQHPGRRSDSIRP